MRRNHGKGLETHPAGPSSTRLRHPSQSIRLNELGVTFGFFFFYWGITSNCFRLETFPRELNLVSLFLRHSSRHKLQSPVFLLFCLFLINGRFKSTHSIHGLRTFPVLQYTRHHNAAQTAAGRGGTGLGHALVSACVGPSGL